MPRSQTNLRLSVLGALSVALAASAVAGTTPDVSAASASSSRHAIPVVLLAPSQAVDQSAVHQWHAAHPQAAVAAVRAVTLRKPTAPHKHPAAVPIPPAWRGGTGPCTGPIPWPAPAALGLWVVPAGCYGGIYTPNPANYPRIGRTFGWCDWWPEALRPGILESTHRGRTAVAGAAVYFPGGLYGADAGVGHYAFVVAVDPAVGGAWMLISEMNFSWRGGGFGRVDYRYVPVGAGEVFYYEE